MPKSKTIKCHWCKKILPIEEAYVHMHETKGGKTTPHKGHEECYQEYVRYMQRAERNKDDFYALVDLLLKIYKVPKLTPIMMRDITGLYRDNYEYSVILGAVKLAKDQIYKNLDKSWRYHFAIIQDKILIANRKISKPKVDNSLPKQKIITDEVIEINIPQQETKQTRKPLGKKIDISTL